MCPLVVGSFPLFPVFGDLERQLGFSLPSLKGAPAGARSRRGRVGSARLHVLGLKRRGVDRSRRAKRSGNGGTHAGTARVWVQQHPAERPGLRSRSVWTLSSQRPDHNATQTHYRAPWAALAFWGVCSLQDGTLPGPGDK